MLALSVDKSRDARIVEDQGSAIMDVKNQPAGNVEDLEYASMESKSIDVSPIPI